MIYSVSFRIKAENRVNEFLRKLDKNLVFLFCNQIYDEYIIDGPINDSEVMEIQNFFLQQARIMNQMGNIIYIYVRCKDQIEDHLQLAKSLILKNQSILMSAVQIANWQYYSIIIFGKENIEMLYTELNQTYENSIIAENEIPLLDFQSYSPFVEIKHILESITDMQLSILKLCIEQDYYSIPRKVYIQDIAKDLNKSRSSVEKVFRAVENRVMDVIIPQIYFYLTDSKTDK